MSVWPVAIQTRTPLEIGDHRNLSRPRAARSTVSTSTAPSTLMRRPLASAISIRDVDAGAGVAVPVATVAVVSAGGARVSVAASGAITAGTNAVPAPASAACSARNARRQPINCDRVIPCSRAVAKAVLVPKPLENPLGRVALLRRRRAVASRIASTIGAKGPSLGRAGAALRTSGRVLRRPASAQRTASAADSCAAACKRRILGADLYHGGNVRMDVAALNPAKLQAGMMRLALALGARLHAPTAVTGVEPKAPATACARRAALSSHAT